MMVASLTGNEYESENGQGEAGASRRVIGAFPEIPTDGRGVLVITIGGLHGNEPSGVAAAARVLERLQKERPEFRGALVCLVGNLQALALGQRYVTEDLNRVWTVERVDELDASDGVGLEAERREQSELHTELEALISRDWDNVILLDLHSTSAAGAPFTIMADTLQNRKAAHALHVPVLLGLEERVDGTLLSYMSERGHVALCVEGGQNDLQSTIAHHEAVIWVTLMSAGLLDPRAFPDLEGQAQLLRASAAGLPRFVEIRHRESVAAWTNFRMKPGFTNFQRVERGQSLAESDENGSVRPVGTPLDGLLIMPRYQGQGDDAFFIGRRVRPVWLHLSALLRRLRLEFLLPLFPGVSRDPGRSRALRVNPHVARWLVVQVLHLFGYRRSARGGREFVFVRRRDVL